MYLLKKDDIEVQISESPLEVRSLKVKGIEHCYQQDGVWKKNWPFLFPVIGRLKNDKIVYQGVDYKMPRHGFFRDISNFKVEDESDGVVTFVANIKDEFKDIYPFEFTIKNQFEIIDNELIVTYEIISNDDKELIFAMGHHPAFKSKKDGIIKFEKEESFTKKVDESGLINSEPSYEHKFQEVTLKELSFENGDSYYTQDLKSSYVEYQDDEIHYQISLEDYNAFIIWSTSNEERFVCLEPLQGIPDPSDRDNNNLEDKQRMIKINKDENYICEFKIKFIK